MITVYKLMRIKDGKVYPLFINKKTEVPLNTWIPAECFPTKGFAVRKGWHCTFEMNAPHLKMELKSGEKRVWVKCQATDYEEYMRPECQGGKWVLAQNIKLLEIIK